MKEKNILFTGPPGCGKSTLIERVVEKLGGHATGFFTREIRKDGQRLGFNITTLDGKYGLLAHRDVKSKYRVGKYGVNLGDIDRIVVPSILPKSPDEIVVIDEIGKMECFSTLFRETLIKTLCTDNPVLGSISLKGNQFIEEVKARGDVLLVHVTSQNRDKLVEIWVDYCKKNFFLRNPR